MVVWVMGYGWNFDNVFIDFWDFLGEQCCYEVWMCVGQEDLWIVYFFVYIIDVGMYMFIVLQIFMWDIICVVDNIFGVIQVDDYIVVFNMFDDIVDDFVYVIFVFFELVLVFGFMYFLCDYLFGCL